MFLRKGRIYIIMEKWLITFSYAFKQLKKINWVKNIVCNELKCLPEPMTSSLLKQILTLEIENRFISSSLQSFESLGLLTEIEIFIKGVKSQNCMHRGFCQ